MAPRRNHVLAHVRDDLTAERHWRQFPRLGQSHIQVLCPRRPNCRKALETTFCFFEHFFHFFGPRRPNCRKALETRSHEQSPSNFEQSVRDDLTAERHWRLTFMFFVSFLVWGCPRRPNCRKALETIFICFSFFDLPTTCPRRPNCRKALETAR